MEKITLKNKELGLARDTDLMESINELANKINEIIDFITTPICNHEWKMGTSGYFCKKCNIYKCQP